MCVFLTNGSMFSSLMLSVCSHGVVDGGVLVVPELTWPVFDTANVA